MFKRVIIAAVMLFASASTVFAQSTMAELPVNPEVRAMTYTYCLTGDLDGIRHLLAQRIAFTGQYTQAQAQRGAAAWVADGYCQETLASADSAMPGLRSAAIAALADQGFTIDRPITQQAVEMDAAESKGFFSWLGKAIRAVGRAISGVFSAGGSGHYEYYENGNMKICDRQWHVGFGSGGSEFEPSPFYPDPNPEG